MKYSLVAAAGLLSVASAGQHDHALFHKRHYNGSDQCSTVWSTWYGEPTMVPLPPPPTTTSTSSSTSTSAAPSKSAIAKPVQALQAAPSPAPGSGGSGQDFFGYALGSSGMNAITYSPYQGQSQASSGCKSSGQIASDIQAIHAKGFTRIRLYATDCAQLAVAGSVAQGLGMRLIVGTFPISPGSADSDFATQLSAIQSYVSANGASAIDAILVANEPFDGGHATVGQVASYLSQAKSAFPNIKVSAALTHNELIQYGSQLCDSMDVVAAQIHPFFSSSYCSPGQSGSYIASEMDLMSGLCGGKPVFVSESGYPSGGGTFLSQIAGATEQSTAIASIRGSARAGHITIFSSSDDTWKAAPGVQAYETMFNCLNLF